MTSFKCPFCQTTITEVHGTSTFHSIFFWKDGSLHIRESDRRPTISRYECPRCGHGEENIEKFMVE